MEGNEAVGWAAYEAGCRFFAGYPITPATTVYNTVLRLLPPVGGVVVQGEDEIASMGLCLGASMSGLKTMTATSGPGISLYSEHISLAVAGEIPLVIVDVMRLGPSTGAATRGADGDVQFLRWGNSGGISGIVLCPVDVKDCFTLTMEAFNLAEIYRCPVFVASNKEIGMTRESVDLAALPRPVLVDRIAPPAGEPYQPFEPKTEAQAPYFAPMGGVILSRQTSSGHGPDGYLAIDPNVLESQAKRLKDKLEDNVGKFSFYEYDRVDGAETLLISYGVTARAARRATAQLNAEGKKVSHLVLKTLWPVPEKVILEAAAGHRNIVVVEMNLGQYVREVERVVKDKPISFYGRMNGQLIKPEEIKGAVHDSGK